MRWFNTLMNQSQTRYKVSRKHCIAIYWPSDAIF